MSDAELLAKFADEYCVTRIVPDVDPSHPLGVLEYRHVYPESKVLLKALLGVLEDSKDYMSIKVAKARAKAFKLLREEEDLTHD